MKSGDNAAISNKLVEIAVANGKTEDEIAAVLAWYTLIFGNKNI